MKKIILALLIASWALLGVGCGEKTLEEKLAEFPYPQEMEIDYTMPVQDCELVMENGVFFGMDYDLVKEICGEVCEFESGDERFANFLANGIFYGFSADEEGVLRLSSMNMQDAQEYYGDYGIVNVGLFRDIHIGDTLESVFAKIPAEDTTLRQWQWQDIYGPNEDGSYAALEYVANSYYALRIGTPGGYMANFIFSREGRKILWVEIYDKVM